MEQQTINIYNTLINKLREVADIYYNMSIDFLAGDTPLKGFYELSKNESKERWHMAHCLIMYLIKGRDIKPSLTQIPQTAAVYNSPQEAIAACVGLEKDIVSLIQNNIGAAEIVEQCKMQELYNEAFKEHNELLYIQRKMNLPGATIESLDNWLYCKYRLV